LEHCWKNSGYNDMRISIIGCGAIGSAIARAIDKKIIPAKLAGIYDLDSSKINKLYSHLKTKPTISKNLLDAMKSCDLVVECASQNAVKEIFKLSCNLKKDIFVLTVGALIVHPEILKKAKKYNFKIYFPSGAIVGLDGINALNIEKNKIKSVTLTTTKPPKSLGFKKCIKRKVVFYGTAEEAVKKYPANINVCATLALSSIGAKRTKVQIVVDPKIKSNKHEIEVISDFGRFTTKTENVPSKENPRTSYLAILSAISALKQLCS